MKKLLLGAALTAAGLLMPCHPAQAAGAEELRAKLGRDCITGQTFEVELSEYAGKVWFVPSAPSGGRTELSVEIMQNGEVLTKLSAYVPEELKGKPFTSLDAVSFYDVNYDGCTDILLIETYGGKTFAAVYYGFKPEEHNGGRGNFHLHQQVSGAVSAQVAPLSVSQIRKAMSGGKRNGEFQDYKEAYRAVSSLCEMETTEEKQYGLVYFDNDATPELVVGKKGYWTSLYTYRDGRVYTLMDSWAYGAMGNAGYEYSPKKNSLRNYNSDYAGAIMYTTYMAIDDSCSLETTAEIKTLNFDDVNGNGVPDENELASAGAYGVSYINGKEATPAECAACDAGRYEYLEGSMTAGELQEKLK